MLFNSSAYLFLFLPVAIFVYFSLNRLKKTLAAKIWLLFASLFFYSYWDVKYLPLILISIIFNYFIALKLTKCDTMNQEKRKVIFWIGIVSNVMLLVFYKYTDFILTNIISITGGKLNLLKLTLPLGISFFTITQIAFLFDVYRNQVKEYKIENYALFVSFFPHLLAGPILHHKEMMPQFDRNRNKIFNMNNVTKGLVLLSLGLFKKVVIADYLASWADYGFDSLKQPSFAEAWITSLAYTFQIYFDFSGYTDMALGSSLLFNIHLPLNFNSPYKALNIQDFWRRWHMTLSRFLRDYLYIPLGGNRISQSRTVINVLITFVIGGIWHGAGWGFLIWGSLHGIAYAIYGQWSRVNLKMPKFLSWFITFNFVNITWIFFRAKTSDDALKILNGMFSLSEIKLTDIVTGMSSFLLSILRLLQDEEKFSELASLLNTLNGNMNRIVVLLILLVVCLASNNSNEKYVSFKPNYRNAIFYGLCTLLALLLVNSGKVAQFLYFNF